MSDNQSSESLLITQAMKLLGAKGGASKSEAKVRAARANVAKAQAARKAKQP